MPRANLDVPDTVLIPEGDYSCKVDKVVEMKGQKGQDQWLVCLIVTEGEYKGSDSIKALLTWPNASHDDTGSSFLLRQVRHCFESAGIIERGAEVGEQNWEAAQLEDCDVKVKAEHNTYQGEKRMRVVDFIRPWDELDEAQSSSSVPKSEDIPF